MDRIAAAADPAPDAREAVAGLLLAAVVPLVGFLVGGVWIARGHRSVLPGAAAVALAVAALAFWLSFTY